MSLVPAPVSGPSLPPPLIGRPGIQSAHIPSAMQTVRYQAPREVQVPAGMAPLVDPALGASGQVQERLVAQAKVFRFGGPKPAGIIPVAAGSQESGKPATELPPTDEEAYQAVWTRISDGLAKLSREEVNFDADRGEYVVLLRWAEVVYLPPGTPAR